MQSNDDDDDPTTSDEHRQHEPSTTAIWNGKTSGTLAFAAIAWLLIGFPSSERPNSRITIGLATAQFHWQRPDAYDDIIQRIQSVNSETCHIKPKHELFLPFDAVSHIPDIKDINPILLNRTNLLHVHNMAINRAFFYSYIFARAEDHEEPGMLYFYLSFAADIAANRFINSSSIVFDQNSAYPNWFRDFSNRTLPLFGPRAVRADDFNDPVNRGRVSTLRMTEVQDLGVIRGATNNYTHGLFKINEWFSLWLPDETTTDYRKTVYTAIILHANGTEQTMEFFGPPEAAARPGPVKWTRPYFDCGRTNQWVVSAVSPVVDLYPRHSQWRHLQRNKYVAVIVSEINFIELDINQCPIGPGNPGPNLYADTSRCKKKTTECEPLLGYRFRRGGYQCRCRPGYRMPPYQLGPYRGEIIERATRDEYERGFDCIRIGDLFVVTQLAEAEDVYLRYSNRSALESYGALYRGTIPKGQPGSAAGVAPDGTETYGNGTIDPYKGPYRPAPYNQYARYSGTYGGKDTVYEVNTAGTAAPPGPVDTPGDAGVYNPFQAQSDQPAFSPPNRQRQTRSSAAGQSEKRASSSAQSSTKSRSKRHSYESYDTVPHVFNRMRSVTPANCAQLPREQLSMFGDVGFGKEEQLDNQARVGLRLAQFLSAFLQIADHDYEMTDRLPDRPLNEHQLFGEVLANVAGDLKILSSGIFYDYGKFPGKLYFGPMAYRTSRNTLSFNAVDQAIFVNDTNRAYVKQDWFRMLRERWLSDPRPRLKERFTRLFLRGNTRGTYKTKYEIFPETWRGPEVTDGYWTVPFYDCYGYNKMWVITYAAPFFGLDSIRRQIEFKGVVTVTVRLDELDITQCPGPVTQANAFKGTDRCDYRTTYCVPVLGRRWDTGGYKCECRQGYEYAFNDPITYCDGQIMEAEWEKKTKGLPNKFDSCRCRLAGASDVASSWRLISLALGALLYYCYYGPSTAVS